MNACQLLECLKGRGGLLRAEGEQLIVNLPDGELTPELREALTQNKPEIMAILRDQASPQAIDPFDWGGRAIEAVISMTTDEFQKAKIAVLIQSDLLGEVVILGSDETVAQQLKSDPRAVYVADEIPLLLGLDPTEIRRLHLAKKTVKGTILPKVPKAVAHG